MSSVKWNGQRFNFNSQAYGSGLAALSKDVASGIGVAGEAAGEFGRRLQKDDTNNALAALLQTKTKADRNALLSSLASSGKSMDQGILVEAAHKLDQEEQARGDAETKRAMDQQKEDRIARGQTFDQNSVVSKFNAGISPFDRASGTKNMDANGNLIPGDTPTPTGGGDPLQTAAGNRQNNQIDAAVRFYGQDPEATKVIDGIAGRISSGAGTGTPKEKQAIVDAQLNLLPKGASDLIRSKVYDAAGIGNTPSKRGKQVSETASFQANQELDKFSDPEYEVTGDELIKLSGQVNRGKDQPTRMRFASEVGNYINKKMDTPVIKGITDALFEQSLAFAEPSTSEVDGSALDTMENGSDISIAKAKEQIKTIDTMLTKMNLNGVSRSEIKKVIQGGEYARLTSAVEYAKKARADFTSLVRGNQSNGRAKITSDLNQYDTDTKLKKYLGLASPDYNSVYSTSVANATEIVDSNPLSASLDTSKKQKIANMLVARTHLPVPKGEEKGTVGFEELARVGGASDARVKEMMKATLGSLLSSMHKFGLIDTTKTPGTPSASPPTITPTEGLAGKEKDAMTAWRTKHKIGNGRIFRNLLTKEARTALEGIERKFPKQPTGFSERTISDKKWSRLTQDEKRYYIDRNNKKPGFQLRKAYERSIKAKLYGN